MSNAKQSELLFIWDARMCNPNGDMAADNSPRFDDADEKAIVSDVRIKRTIRDDLQHRKKRLIFINNEEITTKGLSSEKRFDELKNELDTKGDRDVFLSCIDNRLFGGVAPKSGIQLIGTVQFSWTKSINKTETVLKPGTGAFATDKNTEQGRYQKTFRNDNYIPYAIFAMYGTINRMQAEKATTTEEDITDMLDSLWHGTKFLNTRSKEGQKPRLLIRVVYKPENNYFIGLLDEFVSLRNTDSSSIREISSADIDFSKLINAINSAENHIDEVRITTDISMEKYKEELNKIKKSVFIKETELMQKEV